VARGEGGGEPCSQSVLPARCLPCEVPDAITGLLIDSRSSCRRAALRRRWWLVGGPAPPPAGEGLPLPSPPPPPTEAIFSRPDGTVPTTGHVIGSRFAAEACSSSSSL